MCASFCCLYYSGFPLNLSKIICCMCGKERHFSSSSFCCHAFCSFFFFCVLINILYLLDFLFFYAFLISPHLAYDSIGSLRSCFSFIRLHFFLFHALLHSMRFGVLSCWIQLSNPKMSKIHEVSHVDYVQRVYITNTLICFTYRWSLTVDIII